jgi:hypothetical protein
MDGITDGSATIIGSLIGSFLGLIAILLGALYNAHLNRKRDLELLDKEQEAVARALYSEILTLRKELAMAASTVAQMGMDPFHEDRVRSNKDFRGETALPEPILYQTLAPQIGRLDAELIIEVQKFYARLTEVRKWLPLLQKDDERGYSYSYLHVVRPARDAIVEIVPTLERIEARFGIPKSDKRVELGMTETYIEVEDAEWEAERARRQEDD